MTRHRNSVHVPESAHSGDSGSKRIAEAPQVSHRYISLSWQLTATYHESWSEAEEALVCFPASQRAGIVDSQTGRILASQASYPEVRAAVSDEIIGMPWRDGPLGDLAGERRRAGLSQRKGPKKAAQSANTD